MQLIYFLKKEGLTEMNAQFLGCDFLQRIPWTRVEHEEQRLVTEESSFSRTRWWCGNAQVARR